MRLPLYIGFGLAALLLACTDKTRQESTGEGPLPDTVTFASHIGPLVHQNCMPCHRPNGGGPFSLISYRDVAKRARMVKFVTSTRYMPPWPADPGYRHFIGERLLTQRQIDLIARWADQGAPEGDPSLLPPLPDYPDSSSLGQPDLVVRMPRALPVTGDNRDRFYFVKLPYEIDQDTFVRAIEFVPGNRRVVHHMNANLISYAPGAKRNLFAGEMAVRSDTVPVAEAYRRLDIPNDDGSFPTLTRMVCNYLPGVTPATYPKGIGGFRLSKQGAVFLNDLHHGPFPLDTFSQSWFNIFFADGPPKRPVKEVLLGTLGDGKLDKPLVIPPDTVMDFVLQALVPQDWSLLTINPHMHLLGKSFKAYAIRPQGDTIPLIHIPQWNFRWQYFYTFEKMIHLPRGTLIRVEATFDNTLANPDNPFDPPQLIAEHNGSMRTTDEMLQFILSYVDYQEGDEEVRLE